MLLFKKSVYTLRSLIGLTKILRPTLLLGKKEKKERNILCEIFYNLPQHLNIFINIFSSSVIAFYHSTHVVLHSTTVKQTVAKIMRDFNPVSYALTSFILGSLSDLDNALPI